MHQLPNEHTYSYQLLLIQLLPVLPLSSSDQLVKGDLEFIGKDLLEFLFFIGEDSYLLEGFYKMGVNLYEGMLLQHFHYDLFSKDDGIYLIGSIRLEFLHKFIKIFLCDSIEYISNFIFHHLQLAQNSILRYNPIIQRPFNQQALHLISFPTDVLSYFNIN